MPTRNSELLDQTPPHSVAMEDSVVASALVDPSRLDAIAGIVGPNDFHSEQCATLFRHLLKLHETNGRTVDATLLLDSLKKAGELHKAGGSARIAEMLSSNATAQHAEDYAKTVKEDAGLRRLISAGTELIRHAYNRKTPAAELAERMRGTLDRVTTGASNRLFEMKTAEELMAETFDETFYINPVFIQGEGLTVCGPTKCAKTSLLMAAGVALTTATPFLGDERFHVPRAVRTGIFTGESGGRSLRRLLQRIRDSAELPDGVLTKLFIDEKIPRLDDADHEAGIRQAILDYELEILAVDPLYLGDDEESQGNLARRGQQLQKFTTICLEMGVTPIICCHTKKATFIKREPLDLSDMHGAGLGEFSRQWWLINRRSDYEHDGHHELHFQAGGSFGHGALWGLDIDEGVWDGPGSRYWQVTVLDNTEQGDQERAKREEAAETKRCQQVEEDKAKICRAMAKFEDGETSTVIRETAGLSGTRFRVALAEMLQHRDAVPCQVKKDNRKLPYEGYKLAPQ